MNIYTATITLILVMDPLGNIPVFLTVLKKIPPNRYIRIILRECLIAFVILTLFLFFGGYIMQGLSITAPALNIGGGIILFIIALRMIFPHPDASTNHESHHGEPFIVPLAIPLTAGPAALATVLLFASQEPRKMMVWFSALTISALIFTIVLLCSRSLMKVLGERGLIALERLMGLILTTVAVQMFLSGMSQYFHL